MQNAALFRRGVVVPRNAEAEECLRVNDVSEQTSVRYLEIPDDALFYELWESGLFEGINARLGTLIDDYEEDFVEPEAAGVVLDAIEEAKSKDDALTAHARSFLDDLTDLVAEASKLQRPVLFVL